MVYKVALDTSAYIRPADDDEKGTFTEDKKALSQIRELAKNGFIKLYISTNAQIELNRFRTEDIAKRDTADLFWQYVKPVMLPQEIGFAGIFVNVGRDKAYEQLIKEKEDELHDLDDKTLDSSIILNADFFGMITISTDYRRIRKLRKKVGSAIRLMSPQEFLSIFEHKGSVTTRPDSIL